MLPTDYDAAEIVMRKYSNKGYFKIPPTYLIGLDYFTEITESSWGRTKFSWNTNDPNRITITDRFEYRCVDNKNAREMLITYIHETLHYNLSLYDELLLYFEYDRYPNSGWLPGDKLHSQIENLSEAYANMTLGEFNALRKKLYLDTLNEFYPNDMGYERCRCLE